MALAIRNIHTPLPISNALDALLGFGPQQQLGLHLVTKESRNKAQLFGPSSIHRPVLTVGVDGVQSGVAWYGAQGRDLRSYRWSWYRDTPLCPSGRIANDQ